MTDSKGLNKPAAAEWVNIQEPGAPVDEIDERHVVDRTAVYQSEALPELHPEQGHLIGKKTQPQQQNPKEQETTP